MPATPGEVKFLALEGELVVAQQNEGVGTTASSGNVTVAMDVVRRDQGGHIAMAQGSLVREEQLGAAVCMTVRIPALMSLDSADGSDRNPAAVGVGVRNHAFRA